ncbi:AAA family ATPase [bacterium]|nr:AAA family ATPase [bacterium]
MSERTKAISQENETANLNIDSSSLTKKLRKLRDTLTDGLIERDIAVRLGLLATLAGEHLLLVGPPGTAKSLVARRLHLAFKDAVYFERLLTRFTVPEELFGPLSIKGLEEDRYERLTKAYLPQASIAFLDEIFKANSAILNALLTLLNEREFDNGINRDKTPLVAVVGASNELPEGEELDALFDRFLLRLEVGPVTKGAFPKLLGLRGQPTLEVSDELKLHARELEAVQAKADAVVVPNDVVAMLSELRDWCTAEEIQVSDRRWRKVVKLLQVSAATNGRDQVSIWDCWLLQHCLWDEPESQEKVYQWYAARVGASAAMDPPHLTTIVVSWEAKLKADKASRSQVRDKQGRLVYKGTDGKHTIDKRGRAQSKRELEPLYLAPGDTYVNGSSWGEEMIEDRTNDGKGYTRDELDELYVRNDRYNRKVEFQHWSNRDSYLADQNNWLMEDVDLQPVLEPTRQKEAYIEDCIRELDTHRNNVNAYRDSLLAHIKSLEHEIADHLWVMSDFVQPARENLDQTLNVVDTLLTRIDKVQAGFEGLPREGEPVVDTEATKARKPARPKGKTKRSQ